MATLRDIAKAVSAVCTNHSLLLYGPPKGGKTQLVGTAAELPEINRIFWFDLENGVETLLNSGLTDDQLDKIILIKVRDSRDNPIAVETVLKALTAKTPIKICELHGKVDCAECAKAKQPFTVFCLRDCTHNDLVVIDSGSALGESALAAACLGKPDMFKPTFDEYGMVNKWLGDIMSVIQQATFTNFAVITHEIPLEDETGRDKIYPLMGSKAFSMKCAKFFGTVAYIHKKMNKHVAGSSSTYRGDVLTGSRVNAMLEKAATPDMRTLLVDSGILRRMDGAVQVSTSKELEVAKAGDRVATAYIESELARESLEEAKAQPAASPATTKPLSFAERMALKQKK